MTTGETIPLTTHTERVLMHQEAGALQLRVASSTRENHAQQ